MRARTSGWLFPGNAAHAQIAERRGKREAAVSSVRVRIRQAVGLREKGLEALANTVLPVLGSYTDSTDGYVFIVNASSVRRFVYNDR